MARTLEQLQKQYNSSASMNKKGVMPPPGPRGRHNQGMGGKPKNTKQTVKRLLGYLSPYKFRLVIVVFTMLLATVTSLIGSFMLAPILNKIVGKQNTGALASPQSFCISGRCLCACAMPYIRGAPRSGSRCALS